MAKPLTPFDHRRKAMDCMVKAQFFLLTGVTLEARTDALLYTAQALYHVAASDPDETALAKAEEVLKSMQAGATTG
jgi:hypothetical protein